MRKTIVTCLLLTSLTACSDETGGTAQSRQDFQKALSTFNEAQQGFVTSSQRGGDAQANADIASYRQKTLDQAASELRPLLNSGSDSQRQAANLLLADAVASAADYTARLAMASWADLARRNTQLIDQLLAIDVAKAQVASLNVDLSPALEKLRNDQQEIEGSISTLEKEAQRLHDTAAQDQQVIDGLHTQSEAEQARSQSLSSQAFDKNGATQDSLYRQAMDARSSAISASSSSQKQAAEMDVCLSELAILNQQINLRQNALHALQTETANVQKEQKKDQELHDAAVTVKDQDVKELQDLLTSAAKTYADNVDAPLASAQKQAREAVDLVASVVNKTHGTQKRQVQLDLLVKHTILASILAQHVYAASGYRRTLEVLASQSERLMPGATMFTDAFHQAKEAQDALAPSAKAAITKAIALAAELQQGNDDKATDIFNQLQTYAHNVDDALTTLPPPAPAAATPAAPTAPPPPPPTAPQ